MRNIMMFMVLAFMATAAAETVVDFGRVEQGERPERAFEVQNESECRMKASGRGGCGT